jgi:hypothetical protein
MIDYKRIIDHAKNKGYKSMLQQHDSEEAQAFEILLIQVWLNVKYEVKNLVLLETFNEGNDEQREENIINLINNAVKSKDS